MEWWYMSSNLVLETIPIKLPKWFTSLLDCSLHHDFLTTILLVDGIHGA